MCPPSVLTTLRWMNAATPEKKASRHYDTNDFLNVSSCSRFCVPDSIYFNAKELKKTNMRDEKHEKEYPTRRYLPSP